MPVPPTPSVELSDGRTGSQQRCVAPCKCTQDRANHRPAKAKKRTARVVCRAAFLARMGAGAVLAEAGVFLIDPEGRLHCWMLPWRSNEERDLQKQIAAARALGWS